jgi:hypothetical protein
MTAIDLRRERWLAMLCQLEATNAGCDTAAADYEREIERIDARLREIEGAEHG